MIERLSGSSATDFRSRISLRIAVGTAMLALAACVSDAEPREGTHGPSDARAEADAREGGAGDASRADAPDGSVPEDVDDAGTNEDVRNDGAIDVFDVSMRDTADVADVPAFDTIDAAIDADAVDTAPDGDAGDADARVDASDASDAGTATDARDASDVIDANGPDAPDDTRDGAEDGDASDADAPGDGGDAGDGGLVIFYQETFDSGLGTFSQQGVCGATPPQWSAVSGYAHASEPTTLGVTSLVSQTINVPPNVSNITLRMSHKYATEEGYDAGQLLVSVNGAAATVVTTFLAGGYDEGGATNPANCNQTNIPNSFPGWSGNRTEWVSEANLSNVVGGNTVTITLRAATDDGNLSGGGGWDINWLTLSGNSL